MTEVEWRTGTDPDAMLAFIRDEVVVYHTRWQGWVSAPRFSVSERKWRLFACACCRRVESLLLPEAQLVLEASEDLADDRGDESALRGALACLHHDRSHALGLRPLRSPEQESAEGAVLGLLGQGIENARKVATQVRTCWRDPKPELARQAALLREILGNPFQRVLLTEAVLAWESGLVVRLAEAIQAERAYERMPILADALQDAGCTDEEILRHGRQRGEHVRGCWLVDLARGMPHP